MCMESIRRSPVPVRRALRIAPIPARLSEPAAFRGTAGKGTRTSHEGLPTQKFSVLSLFKRPRSSTVQATQLTTDSPLSQQQHRQQSALFLDPIYRQQQSSTARAQAPPWIEGCRQRHPFWGPPGTQSLAKAWRHRLDHDVDYTPLDLHFKTSTPHLLILAPSQVRPLDRREQRWLVSQVNQETCPMFDVLPWVLARN